MRYLAHSSMFLDTLFLKSYDKHSLLFDKFWIRPRVRQCSIVEEEEEEEEEEEVKGGVMPLKGLSRHSSTSSLAEITAAGGAGTNFFLD